MNTIYLERANSDLYCFCKCKRSLISSPAQLDCPWCGCGWLFTCMTCHKAFTFARGVEVKESLEQLAEMDLRGKQSDRPSKEGIAAWVRGMKIMLKAIRPGETYVYLDGWYLPIHMEPVELDGWHRDHAFTAIPQFRALTDKSAMESTLELQEYWGPPKDAEGNA